MNVAEIAAKKAVDNMTPEERQEMVDHVKRVQSELIDKEVKALAKMEKKITVFKPEADALYEKQKEMPYGEEKREVENARQEIRTEIATLKVKIRNQKNVIKALSNGGSYGNITDKYGTEHENIPDFREVNTDQFSWDIDTIISDKKPIYIPELDDDMLRSKGYIFDTIRIAKDTYILAIDPYSEDEFNDDSPNRSNSTVHGFGFAKTKTNFALLTLDQLVLTLDYYTVLAKANEVKKASDLNELSRVKWLERPTDIRLKYMDYHGKYSLIPAKLRKQFSEGEWESKTLEEKEDHYLPIKKYGTKRIKSKLDEGSMWSSFHNMYQRFINPDAVRKIVEGKFGRKQTFANSEAWAYWQAFREMMDFKIKDIKIQRQDLSDSYKQAVETSFGESNTDPMLKNKLGILIKRQNGAKINAQEAEEIERSWTAVQRIFGNLKPLSEKYNMKVSHSGKRLIFASKAIGVFIARMGTIGVSDKYGYNQFESTMSHEIAHFLDYAIGQLTGKRWATDDYEGTAGQIAFTFRNNMNVHKKQQTDYINATKECFARAFQQYFGMAVYGDKAQMIHSYEEFEDAKLLSSVGHFVSIENFNANVKPLIEQFLTEQKDVLNTTFDLDNSDTIEPIEEIEEKKAEPIPEPVKPKVDRPAVKKAVKAARKKSEITELIEGLQTLKTMSMGKEKDELVELIEGLKVLDGMEGSYKDGGELKSCNDFFDMSSVEQFTELEHPIYSMLNKWRHGELIFIHPSEYLSRIAENFGLTYEQTTTGSMVLPENVKKYAEWMKQGKKAPIPYYHEDSNGQEGRHRAMAAMSLGCESIPVVKIREVIDQEIEEFIQNNKDKSFEELDQEFKEKGYHGISGLDYRELKNRASW